MSDESPANNDSLHSFQRSGRDRRRDNRSAFLKQFYMNRRKGERRDDVTSPSYYVDLHEPWMLVVVILVLVLCIIDSFNTMTLLDHGAEELNPFMQALLDTNIWLFFFTKYLITAAGLILLVMHKHFWMMKFIKTKHLLVFFLLSYVTLIIYEIYLLHLVSLDS